MPEWKEVEQLVSWVESIDHPLATVQHNATLPDLETGEPRQIDVLIEFEHGRLRNRVIGEVRHRNKPGGSQWVEEVCGKMQSVGATGAFMVHTAGFTAPAQKKARKRGIQTVSLLDSDQLHPHLNVNFLTIEHMQRSVGVRLDPLDAYTGEVFDLHDKYIARWNAALSKANQGVEPESGGVLPEELRDHDPVIGPLLLRSIDACMALLTPDLAAQEGVFDLVSPVSTPSDVRWKAKDGKRHKVREVRATLTLTQKLVNNTMTLFGYHDDGVPEPRLLATGRFVERGLPFQVHFLLPRPTGVIMADEKITVGVEPLSDRATRLFRGASLELVEVEAVGGSPMPDGLLHVNACLSFDLGPS